MKVHFLGDVEGDKQQYRKIIDLIESMGHHVVTRHILEVSQADVDAETQSQAELYLKKSKSWIHKADVIIFDTTKPNISIGYEVAIALEMMKPVIIVYHEDFSKFAQINAIKGLQSEKLQIYSYNDSILKEVLQVAFDNTEGALDVRFNFFISPAIANYLDWISKVKRLPRSVYLRKLIKSDMEQNPLYNQEI